MVEHTLKILASKEKVTTTIAFVPPYVVLISQSRPFAFMSILLPPAWTNV